jgi:hypothetical protein
MDAIPAIKSNSKYFLDVSTPFRPIIINKGPNKKMCK